MRRSVRKCVLPVHTCAGFNLAESFYLGMPYLRLADDMVIGAIRLCAPFLS